MFLFMSLLNSCTFHCSPLVISSNVIIVMCTRVGKMYGFHCCIPLLITLLLFHCWCYWQHCNCQTFIRCFTVFSPTLMYILAPPAPKWPKKSRTNRFLPTRRYKTYSLFWPNGSIRMKMVKHFPLLSDEIWYFLLQMYKCRIFYHITECMCSSV